MLPLRLLSRERKRGTRMEYRPSFVSCLSPCIMVQMLLGLRDVDGRGIYARGMGLGMCQARNRGKGGSSPVAGKIVDQS